MASEDEFYNGFSSCPQKPRRVFVGVALIWGRLHIPTQEYGFSLHLLEALRPPVEFCAFLYAGRGGNSQELGFRRCSRQESTFAASQPFSWGHCRRSSPSSSRGDTWRAREARMRIRRPPSQPPSPHPSPERAPPPPAGTTRSRPLVVAPQPFNSPPKHRLAGFPLLTRLWSHLPYDFQYFGFSKNTLWKMSVKKSPESQIDS